MKTILTSIVLCVLGCRLQAQVSFVLSSTLTVGNNPLGVAAADVNGDGNADLVCVNGNDNTLTVLTNNGSGGFVASGTFAVGARPVAVAAADVNGDGKMDLISANQDGSSLSVLTNNGSGGFVLSGTYNTVGHPQSVVAADVNGDGKVDLVSATYDGQIMIFTNDGSGNFATGYSYNLGVHLFAVTTADVNGDGKIDLICEDNGNDTFVFTNSGNVTFGLNATYAVGNGYGWVMVAADLNGDGKADLASANEAGNSVSVLTNNGSGGFVTSGTYAVGANPVPLTAADVNGDGKLDLISANYSGNTLTVLTNDGSGGFVLAGTLTVGNGPIGITTADVNGDGKLDLICANSSDNTLSVLTNATPYPQTTPPCDPAPSGLISWWPGEGNANDNVGGNNGIAQNITYGVGEVGSAFYLNSSNAYVRVPASSNLNVGTGSGFTFETWINPLNINNSQALAEWNNNAGDAGIGAHLFLTESQYPTLGAAPPGCIYANLIDTSGGSHVISTGGGVVVSNSYQHIALTYNKITGVAVLYWNGVAVQTSNLGTFTPQTSYDFYLGERVSGTDAGSYFGGGMDEPSLYNRALSSNEITAIYNAGRAGKCAPTPPPCDPAPSGLISWWPGEGNANNVVGGNNGVVTNGVVLYSTGEVGSAIHYDGNGGYVLIPASASLNVGQGGGFTLEGWIQPGDLINQRPLFEWQFDGVSSGVHFWTSTGGAGCLYANVVDTANNAHPFYSPAGILTSGYQHMALTYDKSTGQASFYRNGALVVSTNLGIFTPKTTGNLLLGERTYLGGASQYNYVGDLDEASVYGRALSLAEIQSIYNAGSAGKCAPTPPPCDPAPSGLISWWPGEGNANDIAGTNNGVVQNILYTGGEVGSAFYLNGSNAFIAMPASSSLNVGAGGGFTFEAWINPGSVLNQQVLAEWNDGAGNIGAQFHLSDSHYPTLGWPVGGFYVNLLDTNGGDHAFTTAAGLVTSNSYQHVALTYDKTSGIAVVYVNGVVVQTENLGFFDIRNG